MHRNIRRTYVLYFDGRPFYTVSVFKKPVLNSTVAHIFSLNMSVMVKTDKRFLQDSNFEQLDIKKWQYLYLCARVH